MCPITYPLVSRRAWSRVRTLVPRLLLTERRCHRRRLECKRRHQVSVLGRHGRPVPFLRQRQHFQAHIRVFADGAQGGRVRLPRPLRDRYRDVASSWFSCHLQKFVLATVRWEESRGGKEG